MSEIDHTSEKFRDGLAGLLRAHPERPALDVAEDLIGYGIGVAVAVIGKAGASAWLANYARQLLAEAESEAGSSPLQGERRSPAQTAH